MTRKSLFLLLFCIGACALSLYSQLPQKPVPVIPSGYRISEDEMRLYRMINDYRHRYDLPPIPLSVSLSYVASTHMKDLFFNHPDQEPCNSHSWSDKGSWKAFCYPRDENKKNSVWDKPKEITPYKGKAYEIVYWENAQANIDTVINFWKSVAYFNSFLMNTGKWQGTKWEAIGVGIYENYACAWFGQLPDPLGPPLKEGENPPAASTPPPVKPRQDSGKKEAVSAAAIPPAEKVVPPKQGAGPGKKPVQQKPAPVPAATPVQKPAQEKVAADSSKTQAQPSPEQKSSVVKPSDTAKVALTYYVIVRTNVRQGDADKIIKFYTDKGFSTVRFLPNEGKGRISVFETSDKATAMAKLKEIKRTYKDAWLLKN